jgi:membrane-associated phospholipid phosphatase
MLGLLLMSTGVYADFPRADGSWHDQVIYAHTPTYQIDVRYPILNSATINAAITQETEVQLAAFRLRLSETPGSAAKLRFKFRCRIERGFGDIINLVFKSEIASGSRTTETAIRTLVYHADTAVPVSLDEVFRPTTDYSAELERLTLAHLPWIPALSPRLTTADFQNFVLLPMAIQFYLPSIFARPGHSQISPVRIRYRDIQHLLYETQPYPEPPVKDYVFSRVTHGFNDYIPYWTSPLRWDNSQWMTAGAVLGITALLFMVDYPIFYALPQQDLETQPSLLRPFFELGDWERATNFLEFSWAFSVLVQDTKLRNATELAVKSFILEALVTQSLKNLINRRIEGQVVQFPGPIWELPSSGGLPSGHATIAWSLMTSYAEGYRGDPVIPYLCYFTAVVSSITLVTTQSHWVSDIIMGAALGYYTAQAVVWLNADRAATQIHPVLRPQGPALALTHRF